MKIIFMFIISAFLTVSCAKRDETGTTQNTDTTVTPDSGTATGPGTGSAGSTDPGTGSTGTTAP